MHLKSLSDDSQGAGDNVAVTAFVHGSKRKVMATPEDYTVRSSSGTNLASKTSPLQELVRVVRRKFEIPERLTLRLQIRAPTSHRTDERWEIEDTAYPLMKKYIDEIEITLDGSGEAEPNGREF